MTCSFHPTAETTAPPPAYPVAEQYARVISNQAVNDEYVHLVLACGRPALDALPGQFFQLLCPPVGTIASYLRRPLSIYRVGREDGVIEFLYKVTGKGTRGLAGLRPGEDVDLLGPLGEGFTLSADYKAIVLVGRGAGLATLAPLAEAVRSGIRVTALLSARSPDLLVSVDLLRACGAEVVTLTDSEQTSGPMHVEAILRDLIRNKRCDAFYTCGSNRLIRVQQKLAREFDIPGQVAMEQQMACGLGMCFCCVKDVHTAAGIVQKRVCFDGPVFPLAEAVA